MAPVRNWIGTTPSWGITANWGGTPAGVPTAVDDLVFGATSPDCVVDVLSPVCRSLDFTSYSATISVNNTITIGTSSAITPGATAGFVKLWPSMGISGTGGIVFRGITNNPRYDITSNGRTWPNFFGATAAIAASTPLYSFMDNFTVGGTFTIGNSLGSAQVQGFNIFCQGNFVTTGAASGTLTALTPVTKVVLGATCTWSNTPVATAGVQLFRTNISIDIQAGSNLVTIADGTTWGGAGTTSSTLRYVSGNVLHQGTFYLQQAAAASFCNINLNGSSILGATAYSTSGVNFQNLQIRNVSNTTNGTLTLTSPIRVVNLFSTAGITGQSGVKTSASGVSLLNGSNLFLGGSCSHGMGRLSGTTTVKFIGSGVWLEPGLVFYTAVPTNSGISNNIVIDTPGTLTLSGNVGVGGASIAAGGFDSTITYTSGNVITTGSSIVIIRNSGPQTLQGFSDIYIENLSVSGIGTSNAGSLPFASGSFKLFSCNFIDTKPLNIGTVGATGMIVAGNYTNIRFSGNVGFTASNFIVTTDNSTSNVNADQNPYKYVGFRSGITYYITKNMIVRGSTTATTGWILRGGEGDIVNAYYDTGNGYTKIVLSPGATQDLYTAIPSRIDASSGQMLKFRTGNVYNFYGSIGFSVTNVQASNFIIVDPLLRVVDTGFEFLRTTPGPSVYLYPPWATFAAGSTYQALFPSRNVMINNYTSDVSSNFIIE